MSKKEQAALKRVAKKLSAMRATLNKDERVWLDKLILGDAEATGHRLTGAQKALRVGRAGAAETSAHAMTAPQKALRVNKALAAETAAHAMTAPQKALRVNKALAAETAAHAMTAPQKALRVNKAQAAQAAAAAAASAALLEFDATTGGYRLNENAAAI